MKIGEAMQIDYVGGEHESVYSYMEWWNYSAFLWDRRDHENSNSVI